MQGSQESQECRIMSFPWVLAPPPLTIEQWLTNENLKFSHYSHYTAGDDWGERSSHLKERIEVNGKICHMHRDVCLPFSMGSRSREGDLQHAAP